jgi:hypothetical protein
VGVGRVNLWIPDAFKANCAIDNTYTFVATVQHCDGSVLEWKGGRYQTKDGAWHPILGDPSGLKPGSPGYYDGVPGTGDPGHVMFEAPPGCYLVSASVHVWIALQKGQKILLGNLATHKSTLDVECDEDTCVTLFQPSGWHCGIIMVLELLLPVMEAQGLIKAEERRGADRALRPILERLQASPFDENELELSRTIAKRLSGKRAPRRRPAK